MDNATKPEIGRFHDLAFGRRPAEELYDLRFDPGQIQNVASLSDYAETKRNLSDRLQQYTKETGDPRALGKNPGSIPQNFAISSRCSGFSRAR